MKKIGIFLFLFLAASSSFAGDWLFLKNELKLGYYNRGLVYLDVPHPPSPIFWEATTKASNGLQLSYARMFFHNRKRFSISLGVAMSRYMFHSDVLYAATFFPELRYWFFRAHWVSIYFSYSVAGPSLLSRRVVGKTDLGAYLIFQDTMGLGLMLGRDQAFNFDVRLVHYSNGDIFPKNPGFDVPVMVYLGYSF